MTFVENAETGGGWYLLGVQSLACICLLSWGIVTSIILLWSINKFVTIRMEVHAELLGADLTEHSVKHGNVGVSRAISVLGPVLDPSDVQGLDNVGTNPMHEKNLNHVKNLSRKKRYKFSRILRDVTRNRNLGINIAQNLFPKRAKRKSAPRQDTSGGKGGAAAAVGDVGAPTHIAWVN
ncbi:hypothetical protein GEV33_007801 [Tenebrio molitor]|uniref:Ammonium transporter AmtB-like domain-containing protein n=1 Tax=Tenebrio molitor TaxID=7067 RepID=A0A8J6HJ14_TENMO|nr:hypothetical protein GEV33_007801 [Tenebrio molitor]